MLRGSSGSSTGTSTSDAQISQSDEGDLEGGGAIRPEAGSIDGELSDPFPALAEQYKEQWQARRSAGETPEEGPVVLFLVGKMGSGKSTVGNLLMGDTSCFEHGRRAGAVTERCRVAATFPAAPPAAAGSTTTTTTTSGSSSSSSSSSNSNNNNININDDDAARIVVNEARRQRGLMVVDTPGFGDPSRSATSILSEIAFMVEKADQAFKPLGAQMIHGNSSVDTGGSNVVTKPWEVSYGVVVVLGCHTRLSLEDLDCVRSLRAVFGSAYLGQCATVVFTHADLLVPEYTLPAAPAMSQPPPPPPPTTSTAEAEEHRKRPGAFLGSRPGVGGGLGEYLGTAGPVTAAAKGSSSGGGEAAAAEQLGLAEARDLLSFARGGVLACTATDAQSASEAAAVLEAAIAAAKGPIPPRPRGKKARRLRQANRAEIERKARQQGEQEAAGGGCVLL